MKNTLLIAAVAMLAVPAMASKARLSALNNSAHLQDVQDVFVNPAKLSEHGDWLTFEMGATSAVNQPAPATTTPQGPYTFATPNAEGGFSRGMGDAKYGFYLGHHSNWIAEARQPNAYITGRTALTDENPVNLFYSAKSGDMTWGVGLDYANSDKKSAKRKQTATGLTAGVSAQHWDAALNLGLANTYKNETVGAEADFKGKTAIGLSGKYTMDTLTFSALAGMNGGKDDTTGNVTDMDVTHYNVGVVNSHKADGADFFYGANYDMFSVKNKGATDTKYDATQLPVFAGIEADATSWMVLRASVSQNLILGTVKSDMAGGTSTTGESDTIPNNTVVAAGVGLKFNKLQLDATLKGSGSGLVDGTNLLSNASLTYLF